MICTSCRYRRDILGDAHIACAHPKANLLTSMMLLSIAPRAARVAVSDEPKVMAEWHGVTNGWVIFPSNFDPTWIMSCDGREERNAAEGAESGAAHVDGDSL